MNSGRRSSNILSKHELLHFISQELQRNTSALPYLLLTTKVTLCSATIQQMRPCPRADKKNLTLGFTCAIHSSHAEAYLRTVDSDVVVLAVNFFQEICLEELWIGFRSWKTSKDITVHHISQLLSPDDLCQTPPPPSSVRSLVMIVSALFRLEKQTVWNAWRAFSITDTLIAITEKPNQPQH